MTLGKPTVRPPAAGAPADLEIVGLTIGDGEETRPGHSVQGQLTIPPHPANGERGAGGVIEPGEHLVFVVDLLEVN